MSRQDTELIKFTYPVKLWSYGTLVRLSASVHLPTQTDALFERSRSRCAPEAKPSIYEKLHAALRLSHYVYVI